MMSHHLVTEDLVQGHQSIKPCARTMCMHGVCVCVERESVTVHIEGFPTTLCVRVELTLLRQHKVCVDNSCACL